jgi:hypothetical protein
MKKLNKYNNIKINNMDQHNLVLKNNKLSYYIINNKRFTTTTSYDLNTFSNYISGLTQTDGTFFCAISVYKTNKETETLRFSPTFAITTDLDSINVLEKIKDFLDCGFITINNSDHSAQFNVKNRKDLINIIIPHFNKYPVFFDKLHAFIIFCNILNILSDGKRKRSNTELTELIKLAISMNVATRRNEANLVKYCNVIGLEEIPAKYPNEITIMNTELKPSFLIGMIDGDSSFNITFSGQGKIVPAFSICIGSTCLPLLEVIKNYIGNKGSLEKRQKPTSLDFIYVYKITDIDCLLKNIIPLVDSSQLYTEKAIHYKIWKDVINKVKNKALTKTLILEIVEMAYNMNKNGKRRKINKEEYIKLIHEIYPNK